MKWPKTITVVRHGESSYNILKRQKEQDPLYKEFKGAYNRRKRYPEDARRLARLLLEDGAYILGNGDFETGLTVDGEQQAEVTGRELSKRIELPDAVLVSPYVRTVRTLACMAMGWPELEEVKTVEEERIREREHGLALLYNDWRIFHMMHPEQDQLQALEGPYWYRFPQGENIPDVRERWRSMLGTLTRDYSDQHVMLVTHHISILALRANLERLGAEEYERLDKDEKPVNCGVTIYRGNPEAGSDGRLELDIYNQKLY